MAKNLTIIGNASDEVTIEALRPNLENNGYTLVVATPADEQAASAPLAMLWITPDAQQEIYDVARRRTASGLKTINMFAAPTYLNPNQKNSIGHNQSLFAVLRPGQESDSICDLLHTLPESTWNEKEVATQDYDNASTTSADAVNTEVNQNYADTPIDENGEEKPEGIKPWKGLLGIIIVVGIEGWIERSIDMSRNYYVDDVLPYVIFTVTLVVLMAITGMVMQYRERYGKSIFSWLVIAYGWFQVLRFAWFIVKNLWNLIF